MNERNQQDALNNAGWVLHDEIRQILGDVPAKLFNNMKPCLQKAIDRYEVDLKPVTPIWNGPEDGLPPVGLEVEWKNVADWEKVMILAHGKDQGQQVAVGQMPDDVIMATADRFRPIRTAEQLAAEEREAAIDEMAGWAGKTALNIEQERRMLGRLYDGGYRKVERP